MKIFDEIELHSVLAGGLAFLLTIALSAAIKPYGIFFFDGALAGSVAAFIVVQFLLIQKVLDKISIRKTCDKNYTVKPIEHMKLLLVNESIWVILIIACAAGACLL